MKIFIETNEKLISTALLILRIAVGVVFLAAGAQKVLGLFGGKGLVPTVTMMSKMTAIPAWLLYISSFAEFFGGIAMLLGLFTRFFGAALVINMAVATVVMLPSGFFLPMGFEFPGLMELLVLAVTLAGPGLFSLDYLLFSSPAIAPKPREERAFKVPSGTAQFRPGT